jgi:hypothetical protein
MHSSATILKESDDVILDNLIQQFQLKIITVIRANNSYDFQCVAGVVSSLEENILIMCIFMNEKEMKLSRRVTKKVNKVLNAEISRNKLKLRYEVREGEFNESPFLSPLKNQHYSLYLIRLLNQLGMKYIDWLEATKGMTDTEVVTLLRLCLDKALYQDELITLVLPEMVNEDLGFSLVLKNVISQILYEYQDISEKYLAACKNVFDRMKRLVNIDTGNGYNFCVDHQDICDYLDQADSLVETWSRASMLNALAESSIRHFNKFATQLFAMQKLLLLVEKSSINKDTIFKGIPESDQIILTGNSSLVPNVDMVNEVYDNVESLANMIANSLASFQDMLQIFVPYLDSMKKNMNENNNNNNDMTFKKSSVKKESNDNVKSKSSSSSTYEAPFAFFHQAKSDFTKEAKMNALQKIKEIERRADAHRNRNKSETAPDIKCEIQLNHKYRVSLDFSSVNKELEIFPFNDTKHIYICFDIDTVSPDEKMQAYKSIVMQSRLLSQDSLGQNGIKLYCLDLLVVKCKTYNNERLLFTAHKIQGTDDHVFIADDLVTHKDYKALLNQPKSMQKRAQDIRDSVTVRLAGRIDLTQEDIPVRNMFHK